jgi:hypothetical protein
VRVAAERPKYFVCTPECSRTRRNIVVYIDVDPGLHRTCTATTGSFNGLYEAYCLSYRWVSLGRWQCTVDVKCLFAQVLHTRSVLKHTDTIRSALQRVAPFVVGFSPDVAHDRTLRAHCPVPPLGPFSVYRPMPVCVNRAGNEIRLDLGYIVNVITVVRQSRRSRRV